jgi:hypothetical protein
MATMATQRKFAVTSDNSNAIEVDSKGRTIIKQLVLLDEVTGDEWNVRLSNGQLIVEPSDLEKKREYKINNLLDDEV